MSESPTLKDWYEVFEAIQHIDEEIEASLWPVVKAMVLEIDREIMKSRDKYESLMDDVAFITGSGVGLPLGTIEHPIDIPAQDIEAIKIKIQTVFSEMSKSKIMKGEKVNMHELTRAYCPKCKSEDVTIIKLRTTAPAARSMDNLEKGPSNGWIPSQYQATCNSCGYECTYET